MGEMHEKPEHVSILEEWMKSYRPAELFDDNGRLRPEIAELAPRANRRMSANPHTNGGSVLRNLRLPDFRDYAVNVPAPGAVTAEATREMVTVLRDVMKLNMDARNFRLFSPDESNSNRWQDALEVTNRAWVADTEPWDDHLAPDGRVMESQRAHARGLGGGLPPDWPPRFLRLVRGVHSHHRFHVQSARQVAKGLK